MTSKISQKTTERYTAKPHLNVQGRRRLINVRVWRAGVNAIVFLCSSAPLILFSYFFLYVYFSI